MSDLKAWIFADFKDIHHIWISGLTRILKISKNILVCSRRWCMSQHPSLMRQEQNISVKFSPVDLNLELIPRFEIGKTLDQAFTDGEEVQSKKDSALKWRVLNFDDLIESKRRAARPKDLLDILQLQSLNGEKPDTLHPCSTPPPSWPQPKPENNLFSIRLMFGGLVNQFLKMSLPYPHFAEVLVFLQNTKKASCKYPQSKRKGHASRL